MNLTAFARSYGLSRNRLARWRDHLSADMCPRLHRVRIVENAAAPRLAEEGIEILVSGCH